MFQVKLLTSLYRSIIIILLLVLSACSYSRVNNEIFNTIYVKPIENIDGLVLRNELLLYFPNQDYNNSAYVLDVRLNKSRSLYLTDSRGFATRVRVTINATITLIRKEDNQIIAQIQNNYNDNYSVLSGGVAAASLEQHTNDDLLVYIAKDIFLKTHSLVKKIIAKDFKENVDNIIKQEN